MKALEFPLSNNFFCVTKVDSTRDNTSHGRKGGFVTVAFFFKFLAHFALAKSTADLDSLLSRDFATEFTNST